MFIILLKQKFYVFLRSVTAAYNIKDTGVRDTSVIPTEQFRATA
jgi:hypothetical protein